MAVVPYSMIEGYSRFKRYFKNTFKCICKKIKNIFKKKRYVNMGEGEKHFHSEYSSEEY